MKKPRKPHWGGLPDSHGLWEWRAWNGAPVWTLWVAEAAEDADRAVFYCRPVSRNVDGFVGRDSGRTVGTIGGLFGRKIAN